MLKLFRSKKVTDEFLTKSVVTAMNNGGWSKIYIEFNDGTSVKIWPKQLRELHKQGKISKENLMPLSLALMVS